jgi:hypothetical protein
MSVTGRGNFGTWMYAWCFIFRVAQSHVTSRHDTAHAYIKGHAINIARSVIRRSASSARTQASRVLAIEVWLTACQVVHCIVSLVMAPAQTDGDRELERGGWRHANDATGWLLGADKECVLSARFFWVPSRGEPLNYGSKTYFKVLFGLSLLTWTLRLWVTGYLVCVMNCKKVREHFSRTHKY